MADDGTFSESWHRVANQRVALNPAVRVRRQTYRGERYHVLEDPFGNQFYRLRPAAWEFVARLDSKRTVEEVWRECLERFPDTAPGQESVVQLLGQLYQAGLLRYDHAADTTALAKRHRERTQRELRARLLNIMFFRIPLFDPDRFLVAALPMVRWLFSPLGALLWIAVVGLGLKTVAENWVDVRNGYEGVLAPGNLPLLYAGLVFLKTLHELGHAFMCRRYGGEVHTLGVMFMIFTPVPYVDVTSSWSFRSRVQRLLVGGAGMIVELFFAAIAVMIWARTAPGALHSLMYNLMFIASVSTLIFNLNPLLRFDGYYMLSDWLEIPNLAQRANQHLRHLCERYLFGVRKSESPAGTAKEKSWLTTFGITSGVYRVIVFAGVLLAVADRYLLLGILMLMACAISWAIVPTGKFISYLGTSPRLDRVRPRAVAVSFALFAAIVVAVGVIPLPNHFRAAGVVQAAARVQVANDVPGTMVKLLAEPGSTVRAGQPLVQLENRQLEIEIDATKAALAEVDARRRLALSEQGVNLRPILARKDALQNQLSRQLGDLAALKVAARLSGIWVGSELRDSIGRWLPRGANLGLIVDPASQEFSATVLQSDADRLFQSPITRAEVKIRGQADTPVQVERLEIVPAERRTLPSAALGWAGGGEIPVARRDPSGQQSADPFFEVRASLRGVPSVFLAHGRSGRIRFDLAPEPLLKRGWRRVSQLLQKRYGI